jgi:ribosomal protein S12 methylthiotransferase
LHYAFLLVSNGCVRNYEAPKICNYLDIPLQHISDSILKSMRRGTKQKNNKIVKEFRAAVHGYSNYFNSRISGETQEDFNILKDFVQEMDRMGCFAYSQRKYTCLLIGR